MKIITTPTSLWNQLKLIFMAKLSRKLPRIVRELEEELKDIVTAGLIAAPETQALVEGPLNEHFGFWRGDEKRIVGTILYELLKQVKVSHRRKGLSYVVEIWIFEDDFRRILSLDEAYTNNKGQLLPWLEWLLFEGDRIIIRGYKIMFGDFAAYSRSGRAIMVKRNGGAWRVPPKYSGTAQNNWLTRVVDDILPMVDKSIQNFLNVKIAEVIRE